MTSKEEMAMKRRNSRKERKKAREREIWIEREKAGEKCEEKENARNFLTFFFN